MKKKVLLVTRLLIAVVVVSLTSAAEHEHNYSHIMNTYFKYSYVNKKTHKKTLVCEVMCDCGASKTVAANVTNESHTLSKVSDMHMVGEHFHVVNYKCSGCGYRTSSRYTCYGPPCPTINSIDGGDFMMRRNLENR